MAELKMIPIDLIDASLHNPRRAFDDDSLHVLANSISRLGVLQPILITERSKEGRYEIVAGERRWRASRIARKTEIPALVVELDDPLLREVQLIENLEREQLNPIEEALAFKSLQERFDYTDVTLAQRLKRSTQFIRSRLDLLKLHPDVQRYVAEERITIGAALEIGRIEEVEAQFVLAEEVVQGKLTALETTSRVNQYKYEKRLQATRLNKKLSLERRERALATQSMVVTPESYAPERHHRVWDLMFPECATCTQKGVFLRPDGQVEDICVKPECYSELLLHQQEVRERIQHSRRVERRRAFEKVLASEDVMSEHLQYLLWTMLNLMGPTVDPWRSEVQLPPYSDAPATASVEWDTISRWSYEQLLTNIIGLSVGHIASLSNSSLPKGLKRSLIAQFGIQPQLLDESPDEAN